MRLTFAKSIGWFPHNTAIVVLVGGSATLCTLPRQAVADDLALIADAQAEVVLIDNGAVGAEVVLIDNGAVGAIQQQFRGQFEPMLKVELSFVNRACKLSDAQRRTLITKSNAWLTEFIADYAKQGGQPQGGGVWFAGGRQPQMTDPRESIQAGVEKLVKADLPKEKAAVYLEESKKRAEFSQKTAVDNLVARIDKELILSPDQREKLTKSLSEHWDKDWAPQLEMFMNGMNMWPNVPDQWIRPHLTAAQRMAWGRLNRQSGHVFFGGMGVDGQVIDDIDLDEGKEKGKDADEKRSAAVGVAPEAAVEIAPDLAN